MVELNMQLGIAHYPLGKKKKILKNNLRNLLIHDKDFSYIGTQILSKIV